VARILIANADPTERLILIGALEGAGHEVVETEDGAHAIELAAQTRPAALVLDEVMPRSGGIATGRAIRRRSNPQIPVVLLVSRANVGEHAVRSTDAVLTKPLDPEELVATVNSVLQ
jgi:CheY-like chemotaxis protein